MQLLKKSLDLADELQTIEERVGHFEREIDERTDRALALDPPETDDEHAEFEQLEAEVSELETLLATTRGYREAIARVIEEWDGTEVVLRELTGAEARHIKDEAAQFAAEQGHENYTDNVHETLFMQRVVESTPPGAPDPDNVGDLPNRIFDWLLTRANNLNTVGGFDMGNSSLRERMMDKRSGGPSDQPQTTESTQQT